MAKHSEYIFEQEATPPTTKKAWPNPRLLLLVPVLAALAATGFFIVRRRSAQTEA